jgi:hypothetical protein
MPDQRGTEPVRPVAVEAALHQLRRPGGVLVGDRGAAVLPRTTPRRRPGA